ncbi:hypothetical protein DEO72_LG3g467 [Vigna unguiculata]|uniref:Uncharacterized protein n=1 Tax=Vigna unguiculata TaxID=3917 RepID=A0A4D6LC08_VIGUN|nr:hypothetical protein DEO72_LG3g467 [Vigna unguiculata]
MVVFASHHLAVIVEGTAGAAAITSVSYRAVAIGDERPRSPPPASPRHRTTVTRPRSRSELRIAGGEAVGEGFSSLYFLLLISPFRLDMAGWGYG